LFYDLTYTLSSQVDLVTSHHSQDPLPIKRVTLVYANQSINQVYLALTEE